MKIKEIMTRSVEMVTPQATLQEAASKMKTHDIGSLPVVEAHRVVGVVTDRDIAVRGTADGKDPRSATVREVMTGNVVTCCDTDTVKDVARTMKDHQIRRVVVVDDAKHLAGIVSLGDLAVDTGDDELKGEILEEVSAPARGR